MKKILLADDSITIQKVVELTFSEGDYQVVCVSNGSQALRKLAEVRPDIVLLDVIMPEKNGYEVCEEIKRNPSTAGIPVLLLTGTFEPFDKKRAEIAGAQGHLTKPFESQVLVGKVEELIAATPTVVSREEAGGMDVISGGDIYHVEAGAPGDAMRPVAPPVRAGLSEPSATDPRPGSTGLAGHPPGPPPVGDESEESEWTDAVAEPPSAASGGSYVGFADLGVGIAEEGQIVPDRYDGGPQSSPRTVKVKREELLSDGSGALAGGGQREQSDRPGEAMEGFTAGFEMPSSQTPSAAQRATPPEPSWTPPPEAPPAETWQTADEEEAGAAPGPTSAPLHAAADSMRPTGPMQDRSAAGLTPEAIDLIAERVVAKLSDRVVREIAWEVIPQVAESLVRRRIKELEEDKTG